MKIVSPKLRWVTVSITSPEGPGRAFQLIFTGMLFEASHSSIIADSNNETLPILHSGFSLATIVPHIDIPPPRAQA